LIVAAIPAFNVEATIARVVIGSAKHVDKVLVCDDGSSDMTGEIAERLGAEVVKHERNLGKGAAIRSLFDLAKRLGADVVVTIDADGQHSPDEIPKLVEPILGGKADIVIGSRSLTGSEVPRYRSIGRRALDQATVAAGHVKVADTQSGFRAYSKDALESLEVTEFGIGVDSEILMKAEGLRLAEVPVGCKYKGVRGSTYHPITHALSVLGAIVTLVGERHPMTFLGIPGFVLVCAGLYGWIWVINRYAEVQTLATGTALLSTILVLIGIFAIFAGLILFTISGLVKRYR
jgi:glycosyltransferase involved in cell wall biosynthesis